jgi:small subunit ribosomal protein S16
MATRIRLRRVGRKKLPLYRIVVAEKTAPRDGRFIDVIGTYSPKAKVEADQITVDAEKARPLAGMSPASERQPAARKAGLHANGLMMRRRHGGRRFQPRTEGSAVPADRRPGAVFVPGRHSSGGPREGRRPLSRSGEPVVPSRVAAEVRGSNTGRAQPYRTVSAVPAADATPLEEGSLPS